MTDVPQVLDDGPEAEKLIEPEEKHRALASARFLLVFEQSALLFRLMKRSATLEDIFNNTHQPYSERGLLETTIEIFVVLYQRLHGSI